MPMMDQIRRLTLERASLERRISEINARIVVLEDGRGVYGPTARVRVRRYLERHPSEDFTPRELATALQIGEHTLRKALFDLIDDREIRRYGPARYRALAVKPG